MKKIFILFLAANLFILSACSEKTTENPTESTEEIEVTEEIEITEEVTEEIPTETQPPFAYEGIANVHNLIYKTIENKDEIIDLKFDILFPTVQKYEKTPLIIGFHGGGWVSGDKSQITDIYSPMLAEFQANGYAVATVQYRLASPKLTFPSPFEDCIDFISYIKDNANIFNIDPENIGVLGYSAGANLAMLCSYAADLNLRYCVSLAGPAKLYDDDIVKYPRSTLYFVETLFGGTYEEREELYKSGSPYFYLESENCIKTPLILIHDEDDAVVPFSQSEIMFEKAVNAGIDSEFLKIRGVGHNLEFITDTMVEPTQTEVMQSIINFIYRFYRSY